LIFEVRFRHNQFEKSQFSQIMQLQSSISKVKGCWRRRVLSAWRFL